MKKIDYSKLDQEGHQTLDIISDSHAFNYWTYTKIQKFTSGKVLEIGSGIGNISQYFVESNHDFVLSEISPYYIKILSDKFPTSEILQLNLIESDFDAIYAHLLGTFDTIFSSNVIEHIENDDLALSNIKKLLKPNGVVIIVVPAFQALYNHMDKELGHFRRYTRKSLSGLMSNHFQLKTSFYFNIIGIFGWFMNSFSNNNQVIPQWQMKIFNALVPLFKLFDYLFKNLAGLSVFGVGTKKSDVS